jgi:hypothetical protein
MSFLLASFVGLLWWQMVLWFAYAIYFICRSWQIWRETNDFGIKEGYKEVFIGTDRHFRLYHLVRTIFDIPPMILGLLFPLLRKILRMKLYTFKVEDKK